MKEIRRNKWLTAVALGALLSGQAGTPLAYAHLFGTFKPDNGQTVWNLLSEGIVNPAMRENLTGIHQLYSDIQAGALPAVSIVKPDGYLDGHPASSRFELFEQFCRKIVTMVQANQPLWQNTAIMITVDEGGGYYDSGYIQPIDFFGDGTRIPLLVLSRYSKGRGMVHTYDDHVSFDKFVEANWNLPTIANDSRDNLPNPIAGRDNPYVPLNSPAIGDLMEMFDFGRSRD